MHGVACDLLVSQSQQRPVAVRLEIDRHQRFGLAWAGPVPGKGQLPARHHLAIDAADVALLAVDHSKDDAKAPACPQVGLGMQRWPPIGPKPAHDLFRVRPCGVDFRRRRPDVALEDEAGLGVEHGGQSALNT